MIVHIGYHKTGTSFLQSQVFPNLKGIKYVHWTDQPNVDDAFKSSRLDIDWDQVQLEIKEWDSENETILHSNEGYVGPLFYHSGLNKVAIANKLKELGATKIIITIRNQISLIDSCYRQFIHEGGTLKYNTFWHDWKFTPNLNHFDFYTLVCYYMDLFGEENVLVLPNELLRHDKSKFISMIEDFTNSTYEHVTSTSRTNASISNFGIKVMRITNMFTYSAHSPSSLILPKRLTTWKIRTLFQEYLDPFIFRRWFKNPSFVSEEEEDYYRNYYAPNNEALQEVIGIDLEELGYPV